MPRPIFMPLRDVRGQGSTQRGGKGGQGSGWHGWRDEKSGADNSRKDPKTMNDLASSPIKPTRVFPSINKVHNFFAHAADTKSVIPMLYGAGIPTGGAHLPGPDIDIVVTWPMSVTRQMVRAQSALTGRHLILMTMKSPIVADEYLMSLVWNDGGIITFSDDLELYTNDGGTFWLSPSREGLLHFQLCHDGLFPKLSQPWRDGRQRKAGFARAADLLTARLLGQAR